jgi:membrane-associated phospholipid phosphatase
MIAALALVSVSAQLILQDPAPLAPEPPAPATPAPAPATPAPATTLVPPAVTPPVAASEPGFFDDFFSEGHVGHYLQWYGGDYMLVAGAAGMWLGGVHKAIDPFPTLIGPRIDLEDPDLRLLNDPRLANQIGMPIVSEQIPERWVAVGLAATLLTNAGVDLAVNRDLHRTHNMVLGSLEAVFGAVAITETLKLTVGRLRPDFRERYTRAACNDVVDRPDALDCSGVPDDGYVPTREDVMDGMKSFPSGHTSTSFAALSFLTLSLGSTYLWGDGMPWWTQPLAGVAIGALSGAALYVSATRLTDNRHHLEDIVAGVGVGMAAGTGAFLLHFEPNGRARRRGVAITPVPLQDGAAVAVSGSL